MSLKAFLTWPHYYRQREREKARPGTLVATTPDQVMHILERHRPPIDG